ncbi:hypothetical protein KKB83_00030 [Patescibacteria group bacterium]|nr:hypothetical protein [Patescibacteria group bacterium]
MPGIVLAKVGGDIYKHGWILNNGWRIHDYGAVVIGAVIWLIGVIALLSGWVLAWGLGG